MRAIAVLLALLSTGLVGVVLRESGWNVFDETPPTLPTKPGRDVLWPGERIPCRWAPRVVLTTRAFTAEHEVFRAIWASGFPRLVEAEAIPISSVPSVVRHPDLPASLRRVAENPELSADCSPHGPYFPAGVRMIPRSEIDRVRRETSGAARVAGLRALVGGDGIWGALSLARFSADARDAFVYYETRGPYALESGCFWLHRERGADAWTVKARIQMLVSAP